MKNNRQIGLDGRVFLTGCLKSSSMYVFGFLIFGLLNAVGDILKLTGKSGEVMSGLTTTLISIDLAISLLIVVVVFYAYFLECGSNIPVLRDKPLTILGHCRLGYCVLLSYYILYRAMFCLVYREETPFSILLFYLVYLMITLFSIYACCFMLNILQRNMIRRSYIKSFRVLSSLGLVFSVLMPITYIVARFWIKDVGDEYFTASLCDLLRLCISPIFYASVWFVFIKATENVKLVFDEVDNAIREKRYQITYTEEQTEETVGKGKKKKKKALPAKAPAAAIAVPEEAVRPAIEGKKAEQPALPEHTEPAAEETNEQKEDTSEKTESISENDNKPSEAAKEENDDSISEEELKTAVAAAVAKDLASDARKPSAARAGGGAKPPKKQRPNPEVGAKQPERKAQDSVRVNVPHEKAVTEFDPYTPKKPKKPQPQQNSAKPKAGTARPAHRAPNGQRPPKGKR